MKNLKLYEDFVPEKIAGINAIYSIMKNDAEHRDDQDEDQELHPRWDWHVEMSDPDEFKAEKGIVLKDVPDKKSEEILDKFYQEFLKLGGKDKDLKNYQDDMKQVHCNEKSSKKNGTFFHPNNTADYVIPFSKEFVQKNDKEMIDKLKDWMKKWDLDGVKAQGLDEYITMNAY
jgi:hypothetical protein